MEMILRNKTNFRFLPRQSGKTSYLFNKYQEFKKEKKIIKFVVENYDCIKRMKDNIKNINTLWDDNDFITQYDLVKLKGKNVEVFLVDEFDFFKYENSVELSNIIMLNLNRETLEFAIGRSSMYHCKPITLSDFCKYERILTKWHNI